jgi:hypothetical protein
VADYSDAYKNPNHLNYTYHEIVDSELKGFAEGWEAALRAVAQRRKKTDNAPLRCPLCESYMYEELHHTCPK